MAGKARVNLNNLIKKSYLLMVKFYEKAEEKMVKKPARGLFDRNLFQISSYEQRRHKIEVVDYLSIAR